MTLFISFFLFLSLQLMKNNYFKGETSERDLGFYLSLIAMLLFALMGIGIDVDQFLQQQEKSVQIPSWYFYLIFAVDLVILISLALIYFYRKVGVFLFPLAMAAHFLFHIYYLDTFLYSDVTALFLYTGIGLLAFIPKWQFFK